MVIALTGQKEMKALQLMVQTYSQNPKFGDAKQFQGELDAATHKVQMFESDLHSLKTELQEVRTNYDHTFAHGSYSIPLSLGGV